MSNVEKIHVVIETDHDIRSHSSGMNQSGNRFLIAVATVYENGKPTKDEISIMGEMNNPLIGWTYELFGHRKTHERWGEQFEFYSYKPLVKSTINGIADYLEQYVKFLGKKRSMDIANHFGEKTLDIIKESPHLLAEVPGIGKKVAESIYKYFENEDKVDPQAYSAVYDIIADIKPPRKLVLSLVEDFGSNAIDFIRSNPYKLLDYPGFGWDRIDKLAMKKFGYKKNGIHRQVAGFSECMSRICETGHTFIEENTLTVSASSLLGTACDSNPIEDLIKSGAMAREEINGIKFVSMKYLRDAEHSIAENIYRIMKNAAPLGFDLDVSGLDQEQVEAVQFISKNGVAILSGVPGSGKSYVTSKIISSLFANNFTNIAVCAPTGKAARRNLELIADVLPGIQIECKTIHSLLGVNFSDEEPGVPEEKAKINRGRDGYIFIHNSDNQFSYDMIIIDEASMSDSEIFDCLLSAIPNGCRFLIVGDHNQLPSVGPGSVLRDLIYGGIPAYVLDQPRRNSGAIAQACYMIKNGKMPVMASKFDEENDVNCIHIEEKDDDKAIDIIKNICLGTSTITGNSIKNPVADPFWYFQVISPEKKKKLGCINLNSILSKSLNRNNRDDLDYSFKESECDFSFGDKVIRIKNKYEFMLIDQDKIFKDMQYQQIIKSSMGDIEYGDFMFKISDGRLNDIRETVVGNNSYYMYKSMLVNGDMGTIVNLDEGKFSSRITVKFRNPDRLFILPKSDAKIQLAYAVTVHKMQGSSFPCILFPLSDFYWNPRSNSGLFSRELVYTAFSRPTEKLITIGRIAELEKAITRKTIHHRKTMLKKYLKELKYIAA